MGHCFISFYFVCVRLVNPRGRCLLYIQNQIQTVGLRIGHPYLGVILLVYKVSIRYFYWETRRSHEFMRLSAIVRIV